MSDGSRGTGQQRLAFRSTGLLADHRSKLSQAGESLRQGRTSSSLSSSASPPVSGKPVPDLDCRIRGTRAGDPRLPIPWHRALEGGRQHPRVLLLRELVGPHQLGPLDIPDESCQQPCELGMLRRLPGTQQVE